MTKREPKEKVQVPTRTARPKGDMFLNLRRPEEVESLSIEELVAPPGQHPDTNTTPRPTPGPPPAQAHPRPTPGPVAPARDFYKRPNSIERDAVPSGLFPGSTKNTYDALYQRTRGAVSPSRSIQATKRNIMLWANVSNEKTIEAHIKHLIGVGLFRRTGSLGDNRGQFYEVFTPEEIGAEIPPGPPPAQAQPRPTRDQFMAPPQAQFLPPGGPGQTVDETGSSGDLKTSFKTNTERSDDDEALAGLLARLKEAATEVTGKGIHTGERVRWDELAEVLVTELKIAAGRTTVSSAPAFLAEHLRRRLFKKDKREIEREAAAETVKSPALTKEQIDTCPDCFGTGMWYPQGYEKGVAKCRHEKLEDVSRTQ